MHNVLLSTGLLFLIAVSGFVGCADTATNPVTADSTAASAPGANNGGEISADQAVQIALAQVAGKVVETDTFKTMPDRDYEEVYRRIFRKYLASDRLIDQAAKKSDTVESTFYVKLKPTEQWLSFLQEFSALEGITGVKMTRS